MDKEIYELEKELISKLELINNIEDAEKIFNILKFIDTYDVSINILRQYKLDYFEENKLVNIKRFISSYEEDIDILRKHNQEVISYVKRRVNR